MSQLFLLYFFTFYTIYIYLVVIINNDLSLDHIVLDDLKAHPQLSIDYRNTRHLVRPGKIIGKDLDHGHGPHPQVHD